MAGMIATEPVLNVLIYGALAALAAALGALPFALGARPRPAWVGAATALAAGLMLGAGYLLMTRGLGLSPPFPAAVDPAAFDPAAVDPGSAGRGTAGGARPWGGWATWASITGAVAGILYTLGVQAYAGLDELEPGDGGPSDRSEEARLLLQHGLHSAAEGIAIGVAMTLQLSLGIFVALALAVHNVGEAMGLTDRLGRSRAGGGPERGGTEDRETPAAPRAVAGRAAAGRAAALGVAVNLPQPVLALAAFALGPVLVGFLPAALGFAAGSLIFLVLTELVPAAYPRAGRRLVALLVSVSAAAVVLLESVLLSPGSGP